MKKYALGAMLTLVLFGIVSLSTWSSRNQTLAQTSTVKAAVIIGCAPTTNPINGDFTGGWTIVAVDSSPSAPPITVGSPCADAIELLFNAGFAIRDVEQGQFSRQGLDYTLVSPIGLANHGE